MRLKVVMINIALGMVLIFLLIKTVGVWRDEVEFPEAASSENAENAGAPVAAWKNSLPSEKAFNTIVKKNLFAQSRSDEMPVEEEPVVEEVVEKRISGKRVVLYGVFIMNEQKSALITNPERARDESKYRWVKEGDKIKNLTVARIEEDSILIKDSKQAYRILLNDEENKAATRGGGSSDSGSANVIVTAPAAESSAGTTSGSTKQTTGQDGYETVDTPFGAMQIRKN